VRPDDDVPHSMGIEFGDELFVIAGRHSFLVPSGTIRGPRPRP
jgi:hypothetical protein